MIDSLDSVLDHLLKSRVTLLKSGTPATVDDGQVRFQPPDDAWRGHVTTLQKKALNVYLVDLRENRKLRSNERTRSLQNGVFSEEPAPARVDCHYLITAASPASEDLSKLIPGKTLEEHQLLQQVVAVLMNTQPLVPRQIFAPNPLPSGFPSLIADAELPMSVLPPEGFPKLAEFWGTMGTGNRWKPVVYLVITIPVELLQEIAGPMVTTTITEYRQIGSQGPGEVWIQIGGSVLDTTPPLAGGKPAPVADAWVRLETTAGDPLQTTESDKEGRFTFGKLQPGQYRLRARAVDLGEHQVDIDVPSPTGNYDVTF